MTPASVKPGRSGALLLAFALGAVSAASAQNGDPTVDVWPKLKRHKASTKKAGDSEETKQAKDKDGDKEPSAKEKLGIDPCAVPASPEEAWVDRMQKGVFWTVCSTSRWFDSFYGEPEDYLDYRSTYGRLGVALEYDEQDGSLDLDTRFKARFELPNLERRIDAFVGRVDEDDFVEGRSDEFGSLPPLFADADAEWLLGLGYRPARDAKSRFDVDGGVKVRFPMDPFVRARWRTHRPLGSKRLLRFTQTGFWRRSLGAGTTSNVDIERSLGPRLLARASITGTVAEEIDGFDWRVASTLYQLLFEDTALAYQIEGRGQTDDPIPVHDWSVGMIYRQRMWRDWLFLELRGRVHWPRQELTEDREAEAGVAIGFEILFGDHPSITRRHPSWEEVDARVQEAAEKARREAQKEEEQSGEEGPDSR
ncbi:MAG: hypothetical protein MPN21_09230 [Thermoanaerobaculia bacterium]|nr:hypothetical protein [Thermoanaerobaculia bacterium]